MPVVLSCPTPPRHRSRPLAQGIALQHTDAHSGAAPATLSGAVIVACDSPRASAAPSAQAEPRAPCRPRRRWPAAAAAGRRRLRRRHRPHQPGPRRRPVWGPHQPGTRRRGIAFPAAAGRGRRRRAGARRRQGAAAGRARRGPAAEQGPGRPPQQHVRPRLPPLAHGPGQLRRPAPGRLPLPPAAAAHATTRHGAQLQRACAPPSGSHLTPPPPGAPLSPGHHTHPATTHPATTRARAGTCARATAPTPRRAQEEGEAAAAAWRPVA
jgi:hypothetical protein